MQNELTADSLKTFKLYANDAANWGGNPWVSTGNVNCTRAMRGNLSDLVQKGLIDIADYGDGMGKYIIFTDAGRELAAACEINLGE
jgi:hypothetical protein